MDIQTLELKIARSENLPVLPQVASAVLRLADDPMASPRSMEKLIEQDPAVSAKILRVANSPFYGISNVNSISRAISVLGMNTVRSLVVSISYQQLISGRSQSPYFDRRALWRHSLTTAIIARIIGKIKEPTLAEELYTAGMMHDIGLLVMDKFYPDRLDASIKQARLTLSPLYKVEKEFMGFDHAEVGQLVAKKWGIGPLTQNAIRWHHDPFMDDENEKTTMIIALSDALAYAVGCINQTPHGAVDEILGMAAFLGIDEAQLMPIQAVVAAEVQKAEEALGVTVAPPRRIA